MYDHDDFNNYDENKTLEIRDYLPGDQIAYVPYHADGDIGHEDVEFGFVTSSKTVSTGTYVFCRYWWPGKEGKDLKTKNNSQGCKPDQLQRVKKATEEQIRVAWNTFVIKGSKTLEEQYPNPYQIDTEKLLRLGKGEKK